MHVCDFFFFFFAPKRILSWSFISQVAFSNVYLSSTWHLHHFVPWHCCPQLLSAVAQLGWNSCGIKQKWKRVENEKLQVICLVIWEWIYVCRLFMNIRNGIPALCCLEIQNRHGGKKPHFRKNVWYELHNKLHTVLWSSEKFFSELYKK